jgi:hypothetical protein
MPQVVFLVSETERPRLCLSESFIKEFEALVVKDPNACVIVEGNDPAQPMAIAILSNTKLSIEENGSKLYKAMVTALHCVMHDEWWTEAEVTGPGCTYLKYLLRLLIDDMLPAVIAYLGPQGASNLSRQGILAAGPIVKCDCGSARVAAFDAALNNFGQPKRDRRDIN